MRSARGNNEEAVYTIRIARWKLDRLRVKADTENRTLAGKFRHLVDVDLELVDDERAAA